MSKGKKVIKTPRWGIAVSESGTSSATSWNDRVLVPRARAGWTSRGDRWPQLRMKIRPASICSTSMARSRRFAHSPSARRCRHVLVREEGRKSNITSSATARSVKQIGDRPAPQSLERYKTSPSVEVRLSTPAAGPTAKPAVSHRSGSADGEAADTRLLLAAIFVFPASL
jgi:hypothetical protein